MRLYTFLSLILVLLLFGCSISEDIESSRLKTLHYSASNGELGETHFYYDSYGLNNRAHWTLLNKSRYSENYYTVNENGDPILKYREFSDSLISYNYYSYNENHQMTKDSFYRSDGIQGVAHYYYDDHNKKLWADCDGLNGWFHGDIYYTYEDDILTSAQIKFDTLSVGKIQYLYDIYGKMIREEWIFNQGFSQTFGYSYEPISEEKIFYNSSNIFLPDVKHPPKNEEYDYSGKSGGPSFFEYDSKGKLVKKTFVRSDSLKTVTSFEFDDSGLLRKSYRNYTNGLTGIFSYTYNANKKLIKRLFQRTDGFKGSEHYFYDNKMQLIRAEWEDFDGWLNGTIIFEHDSNGRIISGKFSGNPLNAEIHFTYENCNNPIKIQWVFENGDTQTYRFSY